jgi:hypothetical protein
MLKHDSDTLTVTPDRHKIGLADENCASQTLVPTHGVVLPRISSCA